MKKLNKKIIILGLGFALLGSACESVPEVYKGALDLPQPEVSVASSSSHQINFGNQSTELSGEEKSNLNEFIYQAKISYGDELYFDFAPDDGNAWAKKEALDNYLKTIGVWVDGVSQTGNVTNSSTVMFVVTRYSVSTPDCRALSKEAFVPTEMETNKIFGCVSAYNLAAHVANPKDLMTGQADTLPVALATVMAIQLYRAKIGIPIVAASTGAPPGGNN
jgi:pilus assembly protein CpaD